MITAYSVFADRLSQTPVFASPLDRGRFFNKSNRCNFYGVDGRRAIRIFSRRFGKKRIGSLTGINVVSVPI